MTGLIRRAALLSAVGVVAASAAMAGIPSATFSSIGSNINVGGHAGGPSILATDPLSVKTMTIRDGNNALVGAGVQVIIDFSGCSDMNLTTGQAGLVCGSRTISALTNGSGVVTFNVSGAANTTNASDPNPGEGCASVTAGGVPLGTLSVGSADLNGARGAGGTCAGADCGVDGTDTLQFVGNRFGPYAPRANLAQVPAPPAAQAIDGVDTLAFAGYRFGGESGSNGPFCNP
jgi:hypothetical protein